MSVSEAGSWISECVDLTIAGHPVRGEGPVIEVEDPSTGAVLAGIPGATAGQMQQAVASAAEAFKTWSVLPGAERRDHLLALADVLDSRRADLIDCIVADAGTPISLCELLQVDAPIRHLRAFADLAAIDRTEHLGTHHHPVASDSIVAYRPAGAVAAVIPYNYPLLLAAVKVGAALAAGCTAVVAPSPQAPLALLMLGGLAKEAGLPPGVLNVLFGPLEVTVGLTEHPDIARVSFTGSVDAGRAVMKQAAGHLAGTILELGGKSASIVLPGTTLGVDKVLSMHLRYCRNAGQGCQSPTRFLIHESQFDEFCALSAEAYERIPVGDPRDPKTQVGPVISSAHRSRVNGYLQQALDEGGTLVAGGGQPDFERGWYVNPALVAGLPNSSRFCQEEIFGPVAAVMPYADIDEAVALANGTEYGLAAHVFGDDREEGIALASRLDAGSVYVNGGGGFRPDAPLAGVRSSGIGREVGEWGIREFLDTQHVQWSL